MRKKLMPLGKDANENEVYIDQFNSNERIRKLLVHVLTLEGEKKSEGVQNRLQPMVWLNDYFENTGQIRDRQSTIGLQDECLRSSYQALIGKKKPDFRKLMDLYCEGQVIHLPVYCRKHLFCLSFFQLYGQLYMGITNGGYWPSATKNQLPTIQTQLPQVIYKLEGHLQLEHLETFYFAGTGRQPINSIIAHLNSFLDQHRVIDFLEVPTTIKQNIGNCGWYNFTCAARLPLYIQQHQKAHPNESDLMIKGLRSFERRVNQLYRDWLREVQVYMLVRSHNRCVAEGWINGRSMQDFLCDCRDKIQTDVLRYADRTSHGYRQGVYDDFLKNYNPATSKRISKIPTSQTVERQPAQAAFFPPPPPPPVIPAPPKKCCIIL